MSLSSAEITIPPVRWHKPPRPDRDPPTETRVWRPKVHSGWTEHGVVLATVKVWPVTSGASLEAGATANLDGVCARRQRAAMPENEQLRDARHRVT